MELQPGWNLLHLSAKNAYGFAGYAEGSVEVAVQAPPDEQTDVHLRFTADPYQNSTAGVYASFRTNGGAWSSEVLLQRTGTFEEHKFIYGTIVVDFDTMSAFDPQTADQRTAAVTNSTYKLNDELIVFRESGTNTGQMDGLRLLEEHDRTDYTDYTLTKGATTAVTTSGGGDLNPFVIQYLGPAGLLQDASIADTTYAKLPFQGGTYLALQGWTVPRAFVATQKVSAFEPIEIPERRDGLWNSTKGFGMGLLDTGIGIWDGIKQVGKGSWHVVKNYNTISIFWRMAQGQGFFTLEDRQKLTIAWQTVETLWAVADKVMRDELSYFCPAPLN